MSFSTPISYRTRSKYLSVLQTTNDLFLAPKNTFRFVALNHSWRITWAEEVLFIDENTGMLNLLVQNQRRGAKKRTDNKLLGYTSFSAANNGLNECKNQNNFKVLNSRNIPKLLENLFHVTVANFFLILQTMPRYKILRGSQAASYSVTCIYDIKFLFDFKT